MFGCSYKYASNRLTKYVVYFRLRSRNCFGCGHILKSNLIDLNLGFIQHLHRLPSAGVRSLRQNLCIDAILFQGYHMSVYNAVRAHSRAGDTANAKLLKIFFLYLHELYGLIYIHI